MQSKNKKKFIFTISYILILILATIAFTYAAFTFSKKGVVENTLETGTVTLTYTEGKTGILLNEVYPISDERGKVLVGEDNVFDFTIQANLSRTMSIGYEVTAVKIPINDMTPLEDDEVRLYLERSIDPDTNYSEVFAPSNFIPRDEQTEIGSPVGSMILDSGTFTQTGITIHHYRLRMWVDENAEIPSGESRKYGVKINVYAKQDVAVSPVESANSRYFTFDVETGTITGYDDSCPKDVVIPYTIEGVLVTTIGKGIRGENGFDSKQLTSVVIPNSVKSINNGAFFNNQLTNVIIPNSVTSIGVLAFSMNQLTSLTIGTSVETIGDNAFIKSNYSNSKLTKIINKTGKSFDWRSITNGSSAATFVTGTIPHSDGNIVVTDK